MHALLEAATANLLSPAILFFGLGVVAAVARTDLELPEGLGRGLAIYLLLAIGFKGGAELADGGLHANVIAALAAAVGLSFALPFLAYAILRLATRVERVDAAAVAAHYGSISVVTFMAAAAFLTRNDIPYAGYMVAMLALMETPAIISGLLLARLAPGTGAPPRIGQSRHEWLREVLLNGSVVLLLGSLLIGWLTGAEGKEAMAPLVEAPFYGVLCLFLLDMGLLVGRRLADFRAVGWGLAAFGLYMPLIGGGVGVLAAGALGMGLGETSLLAVLCASASYIVVPAAMRLALPQAKPALYLTVSLAITFPFNVTVGIPLYHQLALWWVGQG